jgi:hypothetical protein
VSVLSLNPFTISLQQAIPALILVGLLAFVIVFGAVYFIKVDKAERHAMVYMREYSIAKLRVQIEADLLSGGSGIIEAEAIAKVVSSVGLTHFVRRMNEAVGGLFRVDKNRTRRFNRRRSQTLYSDEQVGD